MDIKYTYPTAIPSAPPSYNECIDGPVMTNTQIQTQTQIQTPTQQNILADKQSRLDTLCVRHDISSMFKTLLWNLNEKHIIFLCDDSGSMNARVDNSVKTRWDELKHVVTEVLDISLIFDPLGIDVHFLNRQPLHNARDINKLVPYFRNNPSGGTPLVTKLNEISRLYGTAAYYKISKLLIIATDGEPNDDDPNYTGFKSIIRQLVEQGYHIAFLICTDNESQVEYLNDIDKLYQQVDVTDDYITEKRQIQNVQGNKFKFSYGDYIVKLLAGSFVNSLDSLDEYKLPTHKTSIKKLNSNPNSNSNSNKYKHSMCNIL